MNQHDKNVAITILRELSVLRSADVKREVLSAACGDPCREYTIEEIKIWKRIEPLVWAETTIEASMTFIDEHIDENFDIHH